jgi:hypothetical protein
MKPLLFIIFSLTALITFGQQKTNPSITSKDKGQLLDSIFPIDNILSVKVTNIHGTHILTTKELAELKQATFAGGLLIKPGHIILNITLKDNTIVKSGFVYASTGKIHFDGGQDKSKETFSGTFNLLTQLNFDNYK